MKKILFYIILFTGISVQAQDSLKYHQFSIGINLGTSMFKQPELNLECMINDRIGINADVGYQFPIDAGNILNLTNNKIKGSFGRIGPRLYFASHTKKSIAYLSAGFTYSEFTQSAKLNLKDYYEPFNQKFESSGKLYGSYIGIGALIKTGSRLRLDVGASFNFFSPDDVPILKNYGGTTNAQPGFGNLILSSSGNFGMGLAFNCSIKYDLIKHKSSTKK